MAITHTCSCKKTDKTKERALKKAMQNILIACVSPQSLFPGDTKKHDARLGSEFEQ